MIEEARSEKIRAICAEIKKDMADDAARFEGAPFTGRVVAEYLGGMGAAVAALADFVSELADTAKPVRS